MCNCGSKLRKTYESHKMLGGICDKYDYQTLITHSTNNNYVRHYTDGSDFHKDLHSPWQEAKATPLHIWSRKSKRRDETFLTTEEGKGRAEAVLNLSLSWYLENDAVQFAVISQPNPTGFNYAIIWRYLPLNMLKLHAEVVSINKKKHNYEGYCCTEERKKKMSFIKLVITIITKICSWICFYLLNA